MHAATLDTRVLVLNSSYVPIHITDAYDAICKIFSNIAEAVTVVTTDDGKTYYESHCFKSWREVSDFQALYDQENGYVDEGNDWIRSSKLALLAPRVIRLLHYYKVPQHRVRLSRKNIFARDKNTCQYCYDRFPQSELNIDHVVPKAQGGKNTWTNLVCSCIKCNEEKRDRTPEQAGMKLLKKPVMPPPSWRFNVSAKHKYKDWDAFVSDVYWNTELEE